MPFPISSMSDLDMCAIEITAVLRLSPMESFLDFFGMLKVCWAEFGRWLNGSSLGLGLPDNCVDDLD